MHDGTANQTPATPFPCCSEHAACYIRQWCLDQKAGKHPKLFYIFLNGRAGTGVSHIIK